ncbi:MAG TPA: collagen-binding domain-containing protein [Alphaproteobacteria bacterium]|nr:collagen-binding domain-containing protein [Alphaproteobacteria bacterium]
MAAGLLSAGTRGAAGAPITLGSASSYGLLLGTNETLTTNGLKVTGNLGLSASDKVALTGNLTVTGNAYIDGTPTVSGSGSYTVAGSIVTQSMTAIDAAANSASTTAGALTANLSVSGSAINVTSSSNSIVIKAITNASENVLTISSLALSNGSITFDDNGYSNAKFIVNVTGGFSMTNAALIKGINGASGDDIIFNIEGTGSTVNLTGNSSTSLLGTILAPQRNVTIGGGGNLTGSLIAGVKNAGTSYTVTQSSSGYNITSLGYTPRTTSTPEPSSMALFGAGISALIAARRRRRKP